MGALLFVHFWFMNEKLINGKNYLTISVSKWHDLLHSIALFYLACFVVSTYVIEYAGF